MIKQLLEEVRLRNSTPLLTWQEQTMDCANFVQSVELLSTQLKNISKGKKEKVLLNNNNPIEFYQLLFATILSGHTAILPNKDYFNTGEAFPWVESILSYQDGNLKLTANANAIGLELPNDVNCIVFSSGSTGSPKGISHNFHNFLKNADAVGQTVRYELSLIPLKPYLVSALAHFLAHLQQGAHLVFIDEKTNQEQFQALTTRWQGCGLVGSPIHLMRYANDFPKGQSASYFFSSGDFIFSNTIQKILERHPDCAFYKVYGLAELGGRFYINKIDATMNSQEMDAIGFELPGTRPKIQEQQIFVDADFLFSGYILDDHFIQVNTPHPTGDICESGEAGLSLKGRATDEIKVGGQKVLLSHIAKKISNSIPDGSFTLIPQKHELFGNLICLITTDKSLTRQALQKELRNSLEKYEIPQTYYWAESLPRTASGKIDRRKTEELIKGYSKLT